MSWLESFKARWSANAEEATANAHMDSGWSQSVADRCDRRGRDLLVELVVRLSRVPALPTDIFDRPELAEMLMAAAVVNPEPQI